MSIASAAGFGDDARELTLPAPSPDQDIPIASGDRSSPTDFAGRLSRVLRVAERAVTLLGHDGYHQGETADRVSADKVVAETAMLLLVARPAAAGDPELTSALDRVAALVRPLASAERVRAGLCLTPGLAVDHAFGHICLTAIGFPDRDLDLALDAAIRSGSGFRERLPHRVLEQQWALALRGPADATQIRRTAQPALRASMLGQPLDCLRATREDLYAFTHALMYTGGLAGRFGPDPNLAQSGGQSVRLGLPRPVQAVEADAEAALAWCLHQQDYDLAGELLLTWPLLGRRWSPFARFALRVVCEVEDDNGFLPAGRTRVQHYRELPPTDRSKYALATTYHTVYVMGLLCCSVLRTPATPRSPANRPSSTKPLDLRLAALEHVGAVTPAELRPHWRTVYDRLDDRSKWSIAPIMLTIALRSAAERSDLRTVDHVTRLASALGLAQFPTVRQATMLLERAALMSADRIN